MEETEKELKNLSKRVMEVVSPTQKIVVNDMQTGTERLFLNYLREPINKESIDNTLLIMVNAVEGDITQLETEHEKYARKKGWLNGFE